MKAEIVLTHEFVEYIPDEVKERTLYVSMIFATAVHKCCCGCGREVVTPLSPTDWSITFDGKSISLHPSIGNWSLPCQSHYWIRQNKVKCARRWTQAEIDAGRAQEASTKEKYFGSTMDQGAHDINASVETKAKDSLWRKLKKRLF